MVIRTDLDGIPPAPQGRAVTIGKFQAVHRGHRSLLDETASAARRLGSLATVLTFDRHPAEVLFGAPEALQLGDPEERMECLAAAGVDECVIAAVTPEFLALTAEEFVRRILVERLQVTAVLAGTNFRFGRGAAGGSAELTRMGAKLGFEFIEVAPTLHDGEPISSSRVADAVAGGQVSTAAELLGRPYAVRGEVVPGRRLARTLGFPTANLKTEPNLLLPADGVYAACVTVLGDAEPGVRHPAVCNLGVRPTVDGHTRTLEAHMLDWSGDLYGRTLRLEFIARLRPEQKFPSLDALKAQIALDAELARDLLAR